VRLLFDAGGEPIPEGVDVDLRRQSDDADLTVIPELGVSLASNAQRLALARHA